MSITRTWLVLLTLIRYARFEVQAREALSKALDQERENDERFKARKAQEDADIENQMQ